MKDKTLRRHVIDVLDFEPSLDANHIHVAVDDGIVRLTGDVSTYAQKLAVERLLGSVKGVKGIEEAIAVQLTARPAASDEEIANHVRERLKWSATVPANAIEVEVKNGWVTLTGTVDWNFQKTTANDTARDLKDVAGVSNLIKLSPQPSGPDLKAHIVRALKRSAEIDAAGIEVKVDGDKVTLKGSVKAWYERRIAEDAAWTTPGVADVDDRLTVE